MPGRTPQEAIRAYTEPLQAAVSCLPGSGKILVSSAKVRKAGDEGAWILNGDEGLPVPHIGLLQARQHFKLMTTDTTLPSLSAGKFRVATLSYLYSLRLDSGDHEICWHWHPSGTSKEHRPHMHLSFSGNAHLPCARTTFEDVVESCLEIGGGESTFTDLPKKLEQLDKSRNLHTQNRSWVNWPRGVIDLVEAVAAAARRR